jgi:hypothetical protein
VSTVRLLDNGQRRCCFDCRVRSLTERRGDAGLCAEEKRKRNASRRPWIQLGHFLFSLSIFFLPCCTGARADAARVSWIAAPMP